ncbi:hypothetical protein Tco_1423979, partial [Tanacetum coccineum]
MPPEDNMLPAEEQPLPAAVSPTADSPRYIVDFDPEEDPEEDPADYPVDGGDDDDDDDESSDDDEDDNDDVEEDEDEDEDEEEEHPALTDSVLPPVHRVTARMSIRDQPPTPFWSEAEINRLLAIPSPPPSPLSPLAAMIRLRVESPSTSHPLPLPSPIVLPHTKAFVAMMRASAPSTYILAPRSGIPLSETPPSGIPPLLPIPLPTPSPPLLLPSTVCRAGVSEVTLLPRKRLCIALGSRYEVGESSSAPTARPTRGFRSDYGFVGTLDDEIRRDAEREDTNEIYGRLDDAQDDRSLMSGQLNMLRRDRRAYSRTARLMETEARLSREAWVQSMDASDTAHSEVRAQRTTVLAQTQQTQVTTLQSQQGPASGPAQPEIPEEAG